MDAMLNVLNSAPKNTKKRKPKPAETSKKPNQDSSSPPQRSNPLSPQLLQQQSTKPGSQSPPSGSPVHSPSTLDLDALTAVPQTPSSVHDDGGGSLSFSEPSAALSDYVPLSTDVAAAVTAAEGTIPDQEPTAINVEPLIEKPPQLKVLIGNNDRQIYHPVFILIIVML